MPRTEGMSAGGEDPRSVYDHRGSRRFRARDGILAIAVAAGLLLLFEGPSIRHQGEEMNPGVQRTAVLAVGRPAAWLGDRLPLADVGHRATAWLSPDDNLGDAPGFAAAQRGVATGTGGVPPVTPDNFDPLALGEKPKPAALHTLLVTGDSMVMPLDQELARRLAGTEARTIRDAHVGTGISKSILVDWGKLSAHQVSSDEPDAVVVFIGANEGFPMSVPRKGDVSCCGPPWAAEYATRVRQMMDTYRRRGVARVYWLTLPAPRDSERAKIARAVNAAIGVAAQPFRAQVRVLDMGAIFTPHGYRDSMDIKGKPTIVRESDGIHLSDAGSKLAADAVMTALGREFTW
jgi:lysophospholipase L1-like esterase